MFFFPYILGPKEYTLWDYPRPRVFYEHSLAYYLLFSRASKFILLASFQMHHNTCLINYFWIEDSLFNYCFDGYYWDIELLVRSIYYVKKIKIESVIKWCK
jgi:hypothetical protein